MKRKQDFWAAAFYALATIFFVSGAISFAMSKSEYVRTLWYYVVDYVTFIVMMPEQDSFSYPAYFAATIVCLGIAVIVQRMGRIERELPLVKFHKTGD